MVNLVSASGKEQPVAVPLILYSVLPIPEHLFLFFSDIK